MAHQLTEKEAREIGLEAYFFLCPIVLMDLTRRVFTNVPPGVRAGFGPMNAFWHLRAFPPGNFREVVKPNFDTLYSAAWLDLSREPMVVSAPDTAGRYYLLPMLDMWSDVFAVPGKRTSGTEAGSWVVTPPGWQGKLPDGLRRIQAPTPYVWIIGRTQTNGPADYASVHAIQDRYTVVPLSQLGRPASPPSFQPDPTVDMKTPPSLQADRLTAEQFFAYGAELMTKHPPHDIDWSQLERLRRIGLEPGKPFSFAALAPAIRAALERVPAEAIRMLTELNATISPTVQGWQMLGHPMGAWGQHYVKRAIVARNGLGANQLADAFYPTSLADADGKPLVGGERYKLHFAAGATPPAEAFWSVTLYDGDYFPVPNAIERYAVGDRDGLDYNADGSLDILVQPDAPGPGRQPNWLPSPKSGPINLTMRIYAPRPEAVDGRWNPPPVRKVR